MADRRVLARSRSLEGPHGPPQPAGHVARLGELTPTTIPVGQVNGHASRTARATPVGAEGMGA